MISSNIALLLIFNSPDGAHKSKSVGHDVYLKMTYDLKESANKNIWNDTLELDHVLKGKTLSYVIMNMFLGTNEGSKRLTYENSNDESFKLL